MFSQFGPLFSRLARYFHAYGGIGAVLFSPFFIIAVIVTAASYNKWRADDWIGTAQSLLPNLLGFSLGTYSILFSLLTNRIRRALKTRKNERGVSRLEEVNATFFHFIFVQVVALTWSFLYSGMAITDLVEWLPSVFPDVDADRIMAILRFMGSSIGYTLLVYSFLLILGAALAVYRLALITDPGAD